MIYITKRDVAVLRGTHRQASIATT